MKIRTRTIGGDPLVTNNVYHIVGEIRYAEGGADTINGFYKVMRDHPDGSYWIDLIRMDTPRPGLGNGLNTPGPSPW